MAALKTRTHNNHCEHAERLKDPCAPLVVVQLLWKSMMVPPEVKKLYDAAILLLGRISRRTESRILRVFCAPLFIAASFTIAERVEATLVSTEGWMDKQRKTVYAVPWNGSGSVQFVGSVLSDCDPMVYQHEPPVRCQLLESIGRCAIQLHLIHWTILSLKK